MKTKEEIIDSVFDLSKGDEKWHRDRIKNIDKIYAAMQEYATQQTEAKDREIAELRKDLNDANKLLFEAEKRIGTIRPSGEALKRLITNYLNKSV